MFVKQSPEDVSYRTDAGFLDKTKVFPRCSLPNKKIARVPLVSKAGMAR
jgi:hypothetical protein